MKNLIKAIEYAAEKHKGQIRKSSKEPYITHPLGVSYLLAAYKPKSKNLQSLLIVCILHDTIEDTDATFEEITSMFGPLVSSLVFELTTNEAEKEKLGKNEYLKLKLKGMSSYALTLKLLDRLYNVTDHPTEKYKTDTLELLDHIKKVRKLSKTQKQICKDIKNAILF